MSFRGTSTVTSVADPDPASFWETESKWKTGSGSKVKRLDLDSHQSERSDPDPHEGERSDPYPHERLSLDPDPLQLKSRILIRIKVNWKVGSGFASALKWKLDSDPHQRDPDLQHGCSCVGVICQRNKTPFLANSCHVFFFRDPEQPNGTLSSCLHLCFRLGRVHRNGGSFHLPTGYLLTYSRYSAGYLEGNSREVEQTVASSLNIWTLACCVKRRGREEYPPPFYTVSHQIRGIKI